MKNSVKFFGVLALMLLMAAPAMAADFNMSDALAKFWNDMGITSFFVGEGWKNAVMLGIGCFLLYLAIKKEYEPLLLLPIAFGMVLTNLPGAGMFHTEMWNNEFLNPDSPYYHSYRHIMAEGGLLDILYIGVKAGVYPCLIFLGVGAMTDFGPLIANPKSLLLGAAAQLGIFATFLVTQIDIFGFNPQEAASIGIIGGADGPTAIFLTTKLAPHLLGPIAVAAYSYMALVPVIQPPIMRALTTKKERMIRMKQLRTVSKKEKIVFPIVVAIVVCALYGACEFDLGRKLYKTSKNEFYIYLAALFGVLIFGTVYGVVIGVILSFLEVIIRAVAPPKSFLGIIPGKTDFYDLERNRDARTIEHVVIYRFGGNLFFANIDDFESDIEDAIQPDTTTVVADTGAVRSSRRCLSAPPSAASRPDSWACLPEWEPPSA